MARYCPQCNKQYDISLFQFGRMVRCSCGRLLSGPGSEIRQAPVERDERQDRLARMADRIVDRILRGEARVDVDIAIERMREQCEEWFPDRADLFEMLYESRFERMWQQFREPADG